MPPRITYAKFYNRSYVFGQKKARDQHNRWLMERLKSADFRSRDAYATHVLKYAHTQLWGGRLHMQTVALARRTRRLCEIGKLMRLRVLQARIVRHLWRPGGPLFLRHTPTWVVTPTRGAGGE